MLHAKTAVADGRWARVGSSNLNLASWIGNWELDVAVENLEFGDEMEQMYLQDLDNATEIVLSEKNRVRPVANPRANKPAPPEPRGLRQPRRGSASRLTAGAIRVGNTVGAAITNKLVLGAAEAKIMLFGGAVLLSLAVATLLHPLLITVPFVLIAGWIGLSLLIKAYHLHVNGKDDAAFNGQSNRIDDNGRPVKSRGETPLLLREITHESPSKTEETRSDRSREA
jgi:cardiolipin synthase